MTGAGPPPPGDRLELRGLRVVGRHGVLAQEIDQPQPFEVDVDAWLDTVTAASSDELGDTADYGALVDVVVGVVGGPRSYRLLEALAVAVAQQLLAADNRLSAVAVTVRKLRPPVPHDLGSAGIRVLRRRDEQRDPSIARG